MDWNSPRNSGRQRAGTVRITHAAAFASIIASPDSSPALSPMGIVVAILIFSPVIYALLGIPYRLIQRRRRKRPAPLRLRWQSSPETFRPEPHHWALATALVFSVRNDNAWDSLSLDNPVEQTRASIRRSWGIDDRASLLLALRNVFLQGHRENLQGIVAHAASLPEDTFRETCSRLDPADEEQRELLWQLQVARDNVDGIQSVDFLAWDLVRFVMLCQNGLSLSLIDEEEARDFVLLPARYLQLSYRSWLDCADQFTRARAFWTGGDPAMRVSQDDTRRTVELLQRDRHSPWKLIAWDLSLPRPKGLFAQALLQAGLIAPLEDDPHATVSPFARTLDDMLKRLPTSARES